MSDKLMSDKLLFIAWFILCVLFQIHSDTSKDELITNGINAAIGVAVASVVLKIYSRWKMPVISVAHIFLAILSLLFGYGFYLVTGQFGTYAFSLAVIGITTFNFLQTLGFTAAYDLRNRTSKADSDYILNFWNELDSFKKLIFSIYGIIFHIAGAVSMYFMYFHLQLLNTSPKEPDETRTAEMVYKSTKFYVTPENLEKLNLLESIFFTAIPLTLLLGLLVFLKLGIIGKKRT